MSVSRIAMYETAFKIAADYFPLGAGFGQFGSWMSRIYYSPLYEKYGLSSIYGLSKEAPYHITDTFYPMLIAELGFLGCFIYLVFIFNISYPIFIKLKSGGLPPLKRVFCLAGIVIMIEGLIEGIATHSLINPPYSYFIFGVLGMAYSLKKNKDK